MSLVKKMENGDKTPTLYTHYGKQYDFNELQKSADMGFNDFLGSLKRGEKDQDKFREAYSNIMAGIKDGTITFKNGRYYDSLGRYTNSDGKNKNKDYYGLVANYIYGKQGRSKEYVKPEDKTKIKWSGNSGVGQAFTRNIYGSDNGNIMDFLDLDSYDSESKNRATTNRTKRATDALQHIYNNFDSLFTGYSDSDRNSSMTDIQAAIQALNDGSIDAGDYLALSKAVGGINFRNMFTTEEGKPAERAQIQGQPQTQQTQFDNFVNWVQQKYPQFTGQLNNPRSLTTSRTYGPGTVQILTTAMQKLSNNDLYRIIRSSLSDPKYAFNNEQFIKDTFSNEDFGFLNPFGLQQSLIALKSRGILKPFGEDNLNLYYIPNTDNPTKQTAWVWDDQNSTVAEMSYHDIPYWRERIKQEYLAQTQPQGADSYYTSRYKFKNGGIVKAQYGTVMKRGDKGNWLNVDNTSANASNINTWDTYYNNSGIDADIIANNPWQRGYLKDDSGNIIKGDNGEVQYGLSAGQLGILLNNLNTVGSGLSWDKKANAKGYDQWNRLFDQTGLNTYFGGDSNRFDYLGPSTWNRHALLQRLQQVHGKDNPLKIGNGSIYFDGRQWQLPPIVEKPAVDPVISEMKIASPLPEIIEPLQISNGSYVNPVETSSKTRDYTNLGQAALGFIPEIIGAGRLFDSLRTNNRVTDVIRKSLNPALKDTYELYSPITGAFSEMQLRNRQAADTRLQAARPMTSDASLALAGVLDANRQATNLEYQGFLADDKEVKRTQAEALKRQEDNIARRSAIANENRFSINKTNRDRAELEATRLRRNWQSRDNFLQGVEGRLRNRFEADRERRNNFRLQTQLADIDRQYQDAIRGATREVESWRANNPGVSISSMPGYNNYEDFLREMSNWKNAQTYNTHAGIYGYSYNNDYLNKSARRIAGDYGYYKDGGQLKPSALYLINKVIKNESNT